MQRDTGGRVNRRKFLSATAAAAAWAAGGGPAAAAAGGGQSGANRGRLFKAVKIGMVKLPGSLVEQFAVLKELGFDGVELNSPGALDKREALAASRKVGLPIHGAVNSTHWHTRLSDPDSAVRAKALKSLITALEETHLVGGSAVLLVPGKVTDPQHENQEQVWQRSLEQIRKALPTAAKLGVRVLIENVWNGFCYVHDGPDNQTAEQLAAYIDAQRSPWVGSYFDIGNHRKYGRPEEWIRTLGRRIVKLDVKDWSRQGGFVDIGQGEVDWPEVRKALREIGFTGWCTAEVAGGGRDRLQQIARQMDRVLDL